MHDPLADPLTPEMRAKVEAVANFPVGGNSPVRRAERSSWRLTPRAPTGLSADVRDALFHKMWMVGVPYAGLVVCWQLSSQAQVWLWTERLRDRGLDAPQRPHGHMPPDDWRARLDEILRGVEE